MEADKKYEKDILCFRHARSEFNQGEMQYGYGANVMYNPKYIDAELSAVGVKQCQNAKSDPQLKKVDAVLVSPLRRALQTANLVFGDKGIPIIVRPELAQSFRYSCDLSVSLQQKRNKYTKFDFSHVKDFDQHWEITKILSQRNQKAFQAFLKENGSLKFPQQQQILCKWVKEGKIAENDEELRVRAGKIKETLKEYRQKYKTVAIVSHWWVITFLLGQGYDSGSFPRRAPSIQNAKPIWTSLKRLLQYK